MPHDITKQSIFKPKGWFNIKMPCYQFGKTHYGDNCIGYSIVEIRRSYDCLISTMGFPILARHLYIESGPSVLPVEGKSIFSLLMGGAGRTVGALLWLQAVYEVAVEATLPVGSESSSRGTSAVAYNQLLSSEKKHKDADKFIEPCSIPVYSIHLPCVAIHCHLQK